MSRLEQIRQMLHEDPGDPFLRYALAMELDSDGQPEASLVLYRELMTLRPPHVPAFFRTGQLLARLRRREEARVVLRQGIAAAAEVGDRHAAQEMADFIDQLEASDDDEV